MWPMSIRRACTVLQAGWSPSPDRARRASQAVLKQWIREVAETRVRSGVSVDPGAAQARGRGGQRQARLSAGRRGEPAAADQAAQAHTPGGAARGPWAGLGAARGLGHGLPGRPARRRAADPPPDAWRCLQSALTAVDVRHRDRGSDVVETLARVPRRHDHPRTIRLDTGPECSSHALDRWASLHGVPLDCSPGWACPQTPPASSRARGTRRSAQAG